MSEHYLLSSSLHKERERAIDHAIAYYYQNLGMDYGNVDLQHLAEFGSVTNYSDGHMEFLINNELLVSFGVIEYKIDIEDGRSIMLCRQDIDEHYL